MATEKVAYTAKERKLLTESIKLTDKCCATCSFGFKKSKGQKYACTKGGSFYPFEGSECKVYERNSYLTRED